MTKFRIVVKPENGEPLLRMTYETEEDAEKCVTGIRSDQPKIFSKTNVDLLILIKEAMVYDTWVEVYRDSLFRP